MLRGLPSNAERRSSRLALPPHRRRKRREMRLKQKEEQLIRPTEDGKNGSRSCAAPERHRGAPTLAGLGSPPPPSSPAAVGACCRARPARCRRRWDFSLAEGGSSALWICVWRRLHGESSSIHGCTGQRCSSTSCMGVLLRRLDGRAAQLSRDGKTALCWMGAFVRRRLVSSCGLAPACCRAWRQRGRGLQRLWIMVCS